MIFATFPLPLNIIVIETTFGENLEIKVLMLSVHMIWKIQNEIISPLIVRFTYSNTLFFI